MSAMDDFWASLDKRYEAEKAAGLHDAECEQEERFRLCHCSKRRREAQGHTEVPAESLDFPPPSCPRCYRDTEHDGDGWYCDPCSLSWDSDGSASSAHFTDDHGNLDRCTEHGSRACVACETSNGGTRS